MINFQFYPKNKQVTKALQGVVEVFKKHDSEMDSSTHKHESNKVLSFVTEDLESIGYMVEKGKKDTDKILVPVLYGLNGKLEQRFDADAYNENEKIVIEVEAGRAVTNYQFLKDLFEACVMDNVEYLVVAVRNIYSKSKDFDKVRTFLDTLYASNRLQLPLKGVLIIGY